MKDILAHFDKHNDPRAAADACGVSLSTVYNVLREHRPARARKVRRRTSEKARMIRGLKAQGIAESRIAVLQECSRAYVYKVLAT